MLAGWHVQKGYGEHPFLHTLPCASLQFGCAWAVSFIINRSSKLPSWVLWEVLASYQTEEVLIDSWLEIWLTRPVISVWNGDSLWGCGLHLWTCANLHSQCQNHARHSTSSQRKSWLLGEEENTYLLSSCCKNSSQDSFSWCFPELIKLTFFKMQHLSS